MSSFGKTNMPAQFDVANEMPYKPQALLFYILNSVQTSDTSLFQSFSCFLFSIRLSTPNPRTYIGSGKVSEIRSAIHALDVETVIFDDELSPG